MADINPSLEEVTPKLGAIREEFKKKFGDNLSKGVYDQRDVDRFNNDDTYAKNFLRTLRSKGDVPKALDVVHEAFTFRKEMGLWDLKEDSFPKEMTERNAIYYKGKDREGHPILYVNVKENTAKSDEIPMLKKYIAWNFEQHYKDHPEQMCVVILDMSKAGVSNVNIDVTKFIIACFTNYFPAFLAYLINFSMPTILAATWKIISAFLSSDQKKKLLMLSKKDISKYIDDDNLWEHMK